MSADTCPCCGQKLVSAYDQIAEDARLTPGQARLFLAVASGHGNAVSWDKIIDAIYWDDVEGGPLNARRVVRVTRVYANKKLARFGFAITKVFAIGYRLETIASAKVAA